MLRREFYVRLLIKWLQLIEYKYKNKKYLTSINSLNFRQYLLNEIAYELHHLGFTKTQGKISKHGRRLFANRSTLWDMDHIIPVVEGGGGCGLDNLRTLCIPCHRKVTKKLMVKLAENRKDEKK